MRSRPYSKACLKIVADVGDVSGDDFGDVGVLLCEGGELLFLCLCLELARLLLRECCGALFVFEGEGLLLEGEAVDVRVLDGVGVDGVRDREAGLAEAGEDGVVELQARRARRGRGIP